MRGAVVEQLKASRTEFRRRIVAVVAEFLDTRRQIWLIQPERVVHDSSLVPS